MINNQYTRSIILNLKIRRNRNSVPFSTTTHLLCLDPLFKKQTGYSLNDKAFMRN